MNSHFNKSPASIAACFLLILVTAFGAHAYVLPAPHVLDLMIETLGSARAVEISQKNILLEPSVIATPCGENDVDCSEQNDADQNQTVEGVKPPQPQAIPETVRYIFPKAFRSDISAPTLGRTHIYAAGRSATVVDGAVSSEPESYFDFYMHLLLHRSRPSFNARLAERGINTEVSSIGRFEGRIAFVLGAEYPDISPPQVWIDKETLLPLRWIVQGAAPGGDAAQFEIRYLEWRKTERFWYPDHIEFVRNGTPVRLIQVENVILNPELNRELFSLEGLLARSQPAETPAQEGDTDTGMSDIQKTIEEFKRLFD